MKKDKRRDESDHTFVDVKPTCFRERRNPLKAQRTTLWSGGSSGDDFHPGYEVETSLLQLTSRHQWRCDLYVQQYRHIGMIMGRGCEVRQKICCLEDGLFYITCISLYKNRTSPQHSTI